MEKDMNGALTDKEKYIVKLHYGLHKSKKDIVIMLGWAKSTDDGEMKNGIEKLEAIMKNIRDKL